MQVGSDTFLFYDLFARSEAVNVAIKFDAFAASSLDSSDFETALTPL